MKLILGAIALMGVFGGMTIYESMSGQNEAKAGGTGKKGELESNYNCKGAGNECYYIDEITVKPV